MDSILEDLKDKEYLKLIKDQLELYDQRLQLLLKEREVFAILTP